MVLDFEYVTYRVAVCARCGKSVSAQGYESIYDIAGGYWIEPLSVGHSTKSRKKAVNPDGIWFDSKECLIEYIQYNLGQSLESFPQPDEHVSEM